DVVMPATIDMSTPDTYTFNANTLALGEGAPANDAMAPVNRTNVAPTALPTTANFTGFTGANLGSVHSGWREGAGVAIPTGTTSNWVASAATQQGVLGSGVSAKVNLFTTTRN